MSKISKYMWILVQFYILSIRIRFSKKEIVVFYYVKLDYLAIPNLFMWGPNSDSASRNLCPKLGRFLGYFGRHLG